MQPFTPISISLPSEEPLANQLHRQVTWLIASRYWKPGDRLPSIRQLAGQLGINMLTVRSAYLRLEREGLVQTRQGAGTYVLPFNPRVLIDLAGRSRSFTIGVILPGMSDPLYHDFLEGVEKGIGREHLLLFVSNAHEDPQESLRNFTQLSARNVDGIIVASHDILPFLGENSSAGLPLVTVDSPGCTGPVVNFDLEQAAFLATQHLVEHHYQHIGMITFTEARANVTRMEAGHRRALDEGGLGFSEDLLVRVPGFTMEHGIQGARLLLDRAHPPEAVFTIADTMALGVMKYLKLLHKRIPEDIAIASLDDISLASLVEPGLTTASLPARQLGLEAMNMLHRLIGGEKLKDQSILLPTHLVIRESCGCSA
jgi:LacI family transcriptional regulator, repressor for deo operon, udp, cdd, tsx, nupC, and nupG